MNYIKVTVMTFLICSISCSSINKESGNHLEISEVIGGKSTLKDFTFETWDNKEIEFNKLPDKVQKKLEWLSSHRFSYLSCDGSIIYLLDQINPKIPKGYHIYTDIKIVLDYDESDLNKTMATFNAKEGLGVLETFFFLGLSSGLKPCINQSGKLILHCFSGVIPDNYFVIKLSGDLYNTLFNYSTQQCSTARQIQLNLAKVVL